MTDSAAVRHVLADLGIDAPGLHAVEDVHLFRAEAEQLLPLWWRLRAAHERSGLWPLILGPDDDIVNLGNYFGRDPDTEVARGLDLDALARLAEWQQDLHEDDPDAPPRGEAEGLRPQDEDDFDLAGQPGWIGLVTAGVGHVVPGLLAWTGAENAGLEPADHVAVLKRWHDLYGAELVGLGLDTIELRVPRPPAGQAAALTAAEEQYWYCPDVVDQGVQTLDALAVIQVPSRRWFFWWD